MNLVLQGTGIEAADASQVARISGAGSTEQLAATAWRFRSVTRSVQAEADIASYCETHSLDFGWRPTAAVHQLLDSHASSNGSDTGIEHREHGVARHVDDSAAMGLYLESKQGPRAVERLHCRALVERHQARVARHIGRQNRGGVGFKVSMKHLGVSRCNLLSGHVV